MLSIEEICDKARNLPCSPSLLPEVVELLGRDDAGIDALEQVILKDPGLSAAVLKMANSAMFGSGQVFDNLTDAILRLGFTRTYELTVSVTGGRWSSYDLSAYGWEPGDFCRHSFAVAVASRLVAENVSDVEQELAYTAGMMHDAGKLALALAGHDLLDQVRLHQEKEQCNWMEAEKAVLGFTHAEITGRLMKSWNFPENLIQAGLHYAEPSSAPEAYRSLVGVVHVGKHLAIQSGVGDGEDAFWTPVDPESIASLGIDEAHLQGLMPELVGILEKLLHSEILTGKIKFD